MSIEKYSSKADSHSAKRLRFLKLATLVPCLCAASLLAGCAHRYDMTLTNGLRITNVTKPVYDRDAGTFTYTDVAGNVKHISSGRVVEIAPHSSKNTVPGTMQSKSFQ
jgi:hypothetical protein